MMQIKEVVGDLILIVLEGHEPLKKIDATARDIIKKAGYGDYFCHGTGHGVGIEIHEKPTVSFRSAETAQKNMVFTIEPGIYLPDIGGVRLEEMILVTENGCEVLTEKIPYILPV